MVLIFLSKPSTLSIHSVNKSWLLFRYFRLQREEKKAFEQEMKDVGGWFLFLFFKSNTQERKQRSTLGIIVKEKSLHFDKGSRMTGMRRLRQTWG